MIFNIVFPFESTVYGDSFKEAVKNFIKLNHNLNITRMIIKDQSNQMEANINYYKQDGRNKVGINMFPVGLQYPIPVVTSNDTYIPPRMTDFVPIMPSVPVQQLPILSSQSLTQVLPLSPIMSPVPFFESPFIPTVINIPNI